MSYVHVVCDEDVSQMAAVTMKYKTLMTNVTQLMRQLSINYYYVHRHLYHPTHHFSHMCQ